MKMIPLASSNIHSVGYNEGNKVLRVMFSTGTMYDYSGIPIEVFKGMKKTESPGKYFREFVKGKYQFSKVI